MGMPEVPEDIFLQALVEMLKLDHGWVPSNPDSALYIRPFMFATEAHVGVRPSQQYRFCIFTCPVGAYYTKAVKVKVEMHYTRAAHGGTGAAKAAGNYAGSLFPTELAKSEGYDQILWTDAATHTSVEECGTMNVAFVLDGKMVVPNTSDTVLSGITRASAIALMKHAGVEVEERKVTVQELVEAADTGRLTEAFGLGTAATVSPICTLGLPGSDWDLPEMSTWTIAPKVKSLLDDVRYGSGGPTVDATLVLEAWFRVLTNPCAVPKFCQGGTTVGLRIPMWGCRAGLTYEDHSFVCWWCGASLSTWGG